MTSKLSIICILATGVVSAASDTWTGSMSGSWALPANWMPAATPLTGDTLNFTSSGNVTATNNDIAAGFTFSIVIDSTKSYAISGNSFNAPTITDNNSMMMGAAHSISNPLGLMAGLTVTQANSMGALTLSGVISGPGPLTMATGSTGTLILTNNGNLYTGGTVFNGGVVQISNIGQLGMAGSLLSFGGGTLELLTAFGTAPIPNPITINGNMIGATIQADMSVDVTLSGLIAQGTGTMGTLTIMGVGKVELTNAANTYGGGTLINGGTLVITNDGELGNAGGITFGGGTLELNSLVGNTSVRNVSLATNATIQVDGATSFTFMGAGVVSGTGALNKTGPGTLILSGANTYTGGTNIMGGTLSVTNDGNLGNTSMMAGPLSFGGATPAVAGTLDVTGIATIPMAITLNAGGGILGATTTATFSGNIGGTDSLTAAGPGTVILSGTNTYGGSTTILAGATLQLNAAASLPTTSNVTDNGTLVFNNPGLDIYTGTITGTGAITVQGTGGVQMDGTVATAITTTVNAPGTLSGTGTLGSLINNGTVAPGDSGIGTLSVSGNYTQSAAGNFAVTINELDTGSLLAVSGTAHLNGALNVTTTFPGVYFQGETFTILTSGGLRTGTFGTFSFNPAVPLSITYQDHAVILTVLQNVYQFAGHVNHFNPQQVFKYLTRLTIAPNSDLANIVITLAGLSDPTSALDQLHPALFGAFELINVNTNNLITTIINHRNIEICCKNACQFCGYENMTLWAEPYFFYIDQHQIGEQVGFNTNAGGLVAGFDYCLPNDILVGGAAAYGHELNQWHERRGFAVMDGGYFALYADMVKQNYFLQASAIGGVNSNDSYRKIDFATVHRTARHSHLGKSFNAHVGGGVEVSHCRTFIKPFANLDYMAYFQDAFKEHGAQGLNLNVSKRNAYILRSELGISFAKSFRYEDCGCWSPTVWVSCVNETYLRIKHYTAALQDQTLEFGVRTFNKPMTFVSPGIDFSMKFNSGLAFSMRYSAEINPKILTQKGDVRFEWSF